MTSVAISVALSGFLTHATLLSPPPDNGTKDTHDEVLEGEHVSHTVTVAGRIPPSPIDNGISEASRTYLKIRT